jgi:Zn-finger nucleic acid-binding protein
MSIQTCLRCKGPCVQHNHEGVAIDRCSSCGGAWLDQGELEAIVESRENSHPASFVQETLKQGQAGLPEGSQKDLVACPKCAMNMKVVNYAYDSGVIINVCQSHGIWLDPKELERIEAYRDHWKSEANKRRAEWSEHIRPGSTDGATGSGLLHFLRSLF